MGAKLCKSVDRKYVLDDSLENMIINVKCLR